jgi:hypothetical protein
MLKKNRAAPDAAVIPVLYYPDVRQAVEFNPADWGGELRSHTK